MATWRRKLVRNAWTALLLVFAVRAVAGAALCELYGEHRAPADVVQAVQAHGDAVQLVREVQGHGQHSDDGPSNDRSDHVCEEDVYLTDGWTSGPTFKWSMAMDALACRNAPVAEAFPPVAEASIAPRHFAQPPPSRAPLDIAPRLRI